MIILHQFARNWGIPNQSHFCAKIETYLRLAKLPYQIIETMPLKGPRGKLPFIEDQGETISDTRLIVRHLAAAYGDALDAHLTAEQRGIARAFQRLLEEHLYWVSMYTRWSYTEANWQATKQAIFGALPPGVRDLLALGYRRRIKSQILGHGLGRLTAEEVFALGNEDIDALAEFLGDKPYFLGDRPSALDASAYAVLVNIIACPAESPVKTYALGEDNIKAFCQRIQTECFPELGALRLA